MKLGAVRLGWLFALLVLSCSSDRREAATVASPAVSVVAAPAPSGDGERGVKLRARTGDGPTLASVYRKSYAVVIGVDAYQKLDPLHGAARDARAMAAALIAHGFEVELLVDAGATSARMREQLGDLLPARLQSDDRVVVYFAGHGLSVGKAGDELGYLMPVEGDRDRPVATGLSMAELSAWFERYPAKHVLFLADACYSGLALATRNAGLSPDAQAYLTEVAARRVRFSLVAGTADQLAHEAANQGVFTRFVLEGIAGGADHNGDELVTSDELASFVKPNVASFVRAHFGATQLPQSARSGSGEVVFMTSVSVAASATTPTPLLAAAPPASTAKGKRAPKPKAEPSAAPESASSLWRNLAPKLPISGQWIGAGNPSQRITITTHGGAQMTCRDRSGRFTARATSWTHDEAVFEGQGTTTIGVRAGSRFAITVRLTRAQGGLSFQPTIRPAGESVSQVGQATMIRYVGRSP